MLELHQHKTGHFGHKYSPVLPRVLLSHLHHTRKMHRIMYLILIVGFQ